MQELPSCWLVKGWSFSGAVAQKCSLLSGGAQIHAGGSVIFSDLQVAWRAFLDWGKRNLEGGL